MKKEDFTKQRVVLYSKDISIITGRKYRAALKLFKSIQMAFEKQPGQFITLDEFCLFTGIREKLVMEYLK